MWRVAILLFWLPVPALAQTIKVTSGEHDEFSRLVLTMPVAQPWQVGRTASGYELALEGEEARFDVSGVFDLIPKDRLKGIFVDPISGNLQMTVGCACHALPFSLNETTIVIDLRDGPAPSGSSFEQGLGGRMFAALTGTPKPAVRPRARQPNASLQTFDWTQITAPTLPVFPFPNSQSTDRAGSIRESLVAQLADGAARAVITLALPETEDAASMAPYLADDIPIRIMGNIGLQIGDRRVVQEMLQPNGEVCLTDEVLDLNSWAAKGAATTQYSGLFIGLVGEFDLPQEDAIIAAAKRQIYLGFGAEARSLLTAFGDLTTQEATLLGLADLIDGEGNAQGGVFAGMTSCDSAAAMWAFLAGDLEAPDSLNAAAFKRGFSALPLHLRMHLGPRLIEKLIEADQNELGRSIRDAMGRGPVEDTRAIALATADVLIAGDHAQDAIPKLEAVVAEGGTMQARAVAKLVAAQVAAGQPVDPATADAIHAMITEHKGHPLQVELNAAYGLALAGSQQFGAAVDFSQTGHPLDPAFWSLLAERGSDDEVLLMAIFPPDTDVPPNAARKIADRLDGLGFLNEAVIWRQLGTAVQQDAGSNIPESKARSTASPYEIAPAQATVTSMASEEASADEITARTARWDQDWPVVAQQEDSAWGQLALGLTGDQPASRPTTLAAATASLSRSAEARAQIEQLIRETSGNPASP